MTITIQQTGKLWKLIRAAGTIGVLFAATVAFSAIFVEVGPGMTKAAIVAAFLWIPCNLIARFGTWLFHA